MAENLKKLFISDKEMKWSFRKEIRRKGRNQKEVKKSEGSSCPTAPGRAPHEPGMGSASEKNPGVLK